MTDLKAEQTKKRPIRGTNYERARLIGTRALQISMGDPVLVSIPKDMMDPVAIARLELDQGRCETMSIKREYPNGEVVEIPATDMVWS